VSREAEDSNEIEYYSSDPVDYRQVHKSPEEQAHTEESQKCYIHTVGEGTEEEEEDQDEEEIYEQPTIPTHKKIREATHHHESNRTQPSNAKVKFRHQDEETEHKLGSKRTKSTTFYQPNLFIHLRKVNEKIYSECKKLCWRKSPL